MSAQSFQALKSDVDMRVITDRHISPLWMLLPLASAVVAAGAVAVGFLSSFSGGVTPAGAVAGAFSSLWVLIIPQLLYLYFWYMMIRRRNQHFQRQAKFFADLGQALRDAAGKKGADVGPFLSSMGGAQRQAQPDESEKSAVLWVVLMLVPFVSVIAYLYVFYFLTRDFYRHERIEDGMLADAAKALSLVGAELTFHRARPLPSRSFALYLVLTLVTLGLFGIYWVYTLIQDPNEHFVAQAQFEDSVMQLFAPMT
ncbi:MAG: DUF4234 domain-containing protein [Nitrososphaerota archaeon]|nr:DUF4234 domain-containing protein [Nitrososphaerota archaeon]